MVQEDNYADYLEQEFKDQFGEDSVTREVYTPSGRFCDFLIETKWFRFAVEVENTSDDVVTNGIAQALLYGNELNAIPVVVYPPDGKNHKELTKLDAYCHVVPIPPQE